MTYFEHSDSAVQEGLASDDDEECAVYRHQSRLSQRQVLVVYASAIWREAGQLVLYSVTDIEIATLVCAYASNVICNSHVNSNPLL